MAQDLMLFGDKTVPVPAHIAARFTETNIVERDSLPTLTFTGKVWTITVGGEKTKLLRRDEDGDEAPVATLPVVILDYAKNRGRSFYEGAYDPDNTSSPKCWSEDSITPEDTVPEKVSDKCATCPMAAKGSRVSDNGKATVACSQHRILAVVPVKRLDIAPLRLKLAVTSDYDGQSKDLQAQGKFAFSNYLDFIKARGVLHTASLVTKLAFDPAQAYPKLLFSATRYLTEAELKGVDAIMADGSGVAAILGSSVGTDRNSGALPSAETAANGGTTQAQVDKAAEARTAEAARAAEEAEKERLAKEEKARKAQAAKEKKEREAAEKKAKEESERAAANTVADRKEAVDNGMGDLGDDEEDGGLGTVAAAATNGSKPAGAKTVTEPTAATDVPEGIGGLLDSWGADD